MKKHIKKIAYLIAGWMSLLLAFIGVFLPLLPTTPFVLLAAFCFSRSSEKLHSWLLQHKLFGPLISDWEQDGVIRLKAKWIATISILLLISYPLIWGTFAITLKLVAAGSVCCVLVFIWSRPSLPAVES